MRHIYYPGCETFNHWHSFDARFHDGAWIMLLLLLPINEANTSVMASCNQCPLWVPRMQDLKSLMLHWRAFAGWGRQRSTTYFEQKGGQAIQKEHRCTIVNTLRLTVRHLNGTINRTTRHAKLEIGPGGSSQTWWNRWVDGYGAMFGLRRSSGLGFWTILEPNQTKLIFRSKPRPLAGYPDPFLSLVTTSGQCKLGWKLVN